eukprot:15479126-Alexandrium_andersonii.AAC.1
MKPKYTKRTHGGEQPATACNLPCNCFHEQGAEGQQLVDSTAAASLAGNRQGEENTDGELVMQRRVHNDAVNLAVGLA